METQMTVCVCVCDVSLENWDLTKNNYKLGPIFQGLLMERMDREFAEYLHNQELNPYSQSIYKEKDSDTLTWELNTLSNDATNNIIDPIMNNVYDNFVIKSFGTNGKIVSKDKKTISSSKFLDIFNGRIANSLYTIKFLTPTAFKSDGKYIFFPEPRLIFQSLAMKYGVIFDNDKEIGDEIITTFEKNIFIKSYNLRTHYMNIHNSKIPSFVGSIKIIVRGADTFKNYIASLLEFGKYSGVGIKTSMGMGAMDYEAKEPRELNSFSQQNIENQQNVEFKSNFNTEVNINYDEKLTVNKEEEAI